jgi:hypothetical protein
MFETTTKVDKQAKVQASKANQNNGIKDHVFAEIDA